MGRPRKQGSEDARMVAAQFSSEQFTQLEHAGRTKGLTPNEFMRAAALEHAGCIMNFYVPQGVNSLAQEAKSLSRLILNQVDLAVERHLDQMSDEGKFGAVQALIDSKGDFELSETAKGWSKEKINAVLRAEVINRRIDAIASALKDGGAPFVEALIKHLRERQQPSGEAQHVPEKL